MLDKESHNRFLQFEVWKDCRNGCKFCFNRGLQDKEKTKCLDFIIKKLDDPIVDEFNEIGFIGGEFFDNQLDDDEVRTGFNRIFEKVIERIRDGKIEKVYVTSSLIFKDSTRLLNFFDFIQDSGCIDKFLLCTSYDTIGRFHTEEHLRFWKNNMKRLNCYFPELRLHTEMIITQDFIEKVMNGEFDICEFKERYHTDIDYLEPNTGSFYDGKEEFNRNVPNFLPKRKDFIRFLNKTCIKDKTIELFKLFSKKIRSDLIYLILNGEYVEICGRRNGSRIMGLNLPILPRFGYIDSDIDIADDVEELRRIYEQ